MTDSSRILPCREPADVFHCGQVANHFARAGGFSIERARSIACAAAELAQHALRNGGGDLLVRTVGGSRPGLLLVCTDRSGVRDGGRLSVVPEAVDELTVKRQRNGGLLIVARCDRAHRPPRAVSLAS
ncbi:MAG: hypothetical protein JJ863_12180 [Deltaproteobacteria bacterium]|nr:hypothetical protein [Deltaproteobacteria bacterium]